MQHYGKIFGQYWTSHDIVGLPVETKCLGAYCLSCHHANLLGCFRLPIAYVVDDLRMPLKTVSEGFENLSNTGFLIYDADLAWVLIRKFLKWNPLANPNQGKAAAKLVQQVPINSSVYAPLVQMLKENPTNFPEGFIDGFENGSGTVSKSASASAPATTELQPQIRELTLQSPEPATGPKPSDFVETWNRLRGRLPKVEFFSDSRRKKVLARIRQGVTVQQFEQAVKACTEKPFLRGENDGGWTATFDWLIANDRNIEKAVTDSYGAAPNGVQRSNSAWEEFKNHEAYE